MAGSRPLVPACAAVLLLVALAAPAEAAMGSVCYAGCQSAAAAGCGIAAGPAFVACYAAGQSTCAVSCGIAGAAAVAAGAVMGPVGFVAAVATRAVGVALSLLTLGWLRRR